MRTKIVNFLHALHEAFVAGLVVVILIGIIGYSLYLIFTNGQYLAEGFGSALGITLLGSIVRYYKISHKLVLSLLPKRWQPSDLPTDTEVK